MHDKTVPIPDGLAATRESLATHRNAAEIGKGACHLLCLSEADVMRLIDLAEICIASLHHADAEALARRRPKVVLGALNHRLRLPCR